MRKGFLTAGLLLGALASGAGGAGLKDLGPIGDKTLVAWVSPANLEQQGGAVLGLMEQERFDALVLGEKRRGVWMAGSDFFKRTQADQSAAPLETAPPGRFVQLAAVYAGTRITLYREGQVYADYEAGAQQSFDAAADVLIGLRYLGGMGEIGPFQGEIEEVRLYDRGLRPEEIAGLQLGKISQPPPRGWWTFQKGRATDEMRHYPEGQLRNGARIADGRLQLQGRAYVAVTSRPPEKRGGTQAGFYTPARRGQMWDTWAYFHKGRYYLYYLAGPGGAWDGHELAISTDGVHWKEAGVMVRPRAGVTWMGTGHIWPRPGRRNEWVMNYSEWFGDKQDIMFATSGDLVKWAKADERLRFAQDTRWYQAKGRWDCIDTVARPGGGLYGYFTADPDPAKVGYRPCGFGFAESRDGLAWTALPPVEGDIAGEFGGIEKIGNRYYIMISEGRVAAGDRPEGPFWSQKKNPNAFGAGCDIYFPRFFHNAPGGPLVNHFYNNGAVHAAPFKAVETDAAGVLRLKWWPGNDRLKRRALKTAWAADPASPAVRLASRSLDPARTHVVEGAARLGPAGSGPAATGLYFDRGNGQGDALVFDRTGARFGTIRADGAGFNAVQTANRDLDLGETLRFRLVFKGDMLELYLNDYLMNLKRSAWNGRLGLLGVARDGAFGPVKIWSDN